MSVAANLLKEARLAAGLTQVELARRAATSQSAVAAYESATKVPSAETLDRLLRAAGAQIGTRPLPRRVPRTAGLRKLLQDYRSDILEVAATHRAANVRVFGSVARGEGNEGSDVDLIVDMEAGSSLLDQVRLRRALTELLGVEIDVVTSGGLLDRDDAILEEATPI